LRILSQGADANYRSSEEGMSCIHHAVINNRIGQIELLCLYGADVTAVDKNGQTPYDLAKQNELHAIADRLLELQFELTDELTYFLCSKRVEHKSGNHFFIPDLNEM
jgi:G protein-coupled receptor kinase interactor 2